MGRPVVAPYPALACHAISKFKCSTFDSDRAAKSLDDGHPVKVRASIDLSDGGQPVGDVLGGKRTHGGRVHLGPGTGDRRDSRFLLVHGASLVTWAMPPRRAQSGGGGLSIARAYPARPFLAGGRYPRSRAPRTQSAAVSRLWPYSFAMVAVGLCTPLL